MTRLARQSFQCMPLVLALLFAPVANAQTPGDDAQSKPQGRSGGSGQPHPGAPRPHAPQPTPPHAQQPPPQYPHAQPPHGQQPHGQQPPVQQPQGQHPHAQQPRGPQPYAQQPRVQPGHPGPPSPPSVRRTPGQYPLARSPLRVYPAPRFYGTRPTVHVPCIRYPHAYYSFQPRYFLGFGIYVGYPVDYPLVYGYPAYVYSDGAIIEASPAEESYGRVSFTITPDDASVLVDGAYVGIARDFSKHHQPLTLAPGPHHIELQASGRVPLAFDVNTVAGQVLPFKGTLRPE